MFAHPGMWMVIAWRWWGGRDPRAGVWSLADMFVFVQVCMYFRWLY